MCRSRTVVFKEYTREYKCVIPLSCAFKRLVSRSCWPSLAWASICPLLRREEDPREVQGSSMVSQHKIPRLFCSVGLRGVWKWIWKGGLGVLQPYLARYLLY